MANLSYIFGPGDETKRFVRRYLKATHCDLFFADGIIFVEGQAERILVPHFIRHHFPDLARRYTTLLELGGSHAHSFRELVDELGLTTLIIGDLDATVATRVLLKTGGETKRWKAARPAKGASQKSANQVLKEWHPRKENVDDLIELKPEEHALTSADGYCLYVAYQKAVAVAAPDGAAKLTIPRTFEDALILENLSVITNVAGSRTSDSIRQIVASGITGDELEDELFLLLKTAEKAAFALDCLMLPDPTALKPPEYIRTGLDWFQNAVTRDISDSEPTGAST